MTSKKYDRLMLPDDLQGKYTADDIICYAYYPIDCVGRVIQHFHTYNNSVTSLEEKDGRQRSRHLEDPEPFDVEPGDWFEVEVR